MDCSAFIASLIGGWFACLPICFALKANRPTYYRRVCIWMLFHMSVNYLYVVSLELWLVGLAVNFLWILYLLIFGDKKWQRSNK